MVSVSHFRQRSYSQEINRKFQTWGFQKSFSIISWQLHREIIRFPRRKWYGWSIVNMKLWLPVRSQGLGRVGAGGPDAQTGKGSKQVSLFGHVKMKMSLHVYTLQQNTVEKCQRFVPFCRQLKLSDIPPWMGVCRKIYLGACGRKIQNPTFGLSPSPFKHVVTETCVVFETILETHAGPWVTPPLNLRPPLSLNPKAQKILLKRKMHQLH